MKRTFSYILGIVLVLVVFGKTSAQSFFLPSDTIQKPKVIQFSGLVVGGDSLYGIPGVLVYVPNTSRGTITSSVGYFSFPALVGDSVVIHSLGFRQKHLIIPAIQDEKLSVVIELKEDTLTLPDVTILPWPTERLFKEALVSLKLPHAELDNMHKNLNEQVMKRIMYTTGPDGAMNHKYYMQQQITRSENKMSYDKTINFLNPFAWGRFINQIKRGEHKNKAAEYADEDDE